jgi:hypothetical protein
MKHPNFPGGGGEHIDGSSRRNSLRLQESQPKSLGIEVVSSQSKVSVSVDGTTVSRHTAAACPAILDKLVQDGRSTMQQYCYYQTSLDWLIGLIALTKKRLVKI